MTKIATHLGFHNVCAITVTKIRDYKLGTGETLYSNEIVLTDMDGFSLHINIFGDIEFPIKVVED